MHIEGRIKKVFFDNESFMAGIFEPRTEDGIDPVIMGSSSHGSYRFNGNHLLGDIKPTGLLAIFHGEWEEDSKYGWSFKCSAIEPLIKDDLYFFLVNYIHGIGTKLAKRLLKDFGSDRLIDMIENRPHELIAINGIGSSIQAKIVASWGKYKSIKELSTLLLPAGCTPGQIQKICRHFGPSEELVSNISENPYMLTDVSGIGFVFCDNLAMRIGIDEHSPLRANAALLYAMDMISMATGNTMINYQNVLDMCIRDLGILLPVNEWGERIRDLLDSNVLVKVKNGYLALKAVYDAELFIYNFLTERASEPMAPVLGDIELKHLISKLENAQGFHYNQKQRDSIEQANCRTISIISGIAGAGKTTCSKGVLEVMKHYTSSSNIYVTALSGIATDRIKKATGFQGGTIQSLLVGCRDGAELEYDVLAIDESSMIPSLTLASLLKKVKKTCRIILIGDKSQIDPVAPGSPFSDLVNNTVLPITNLTEPNRQSEKSQIITVANSVRKGVYPTQLNVPGGDFAFQKYAIDDYYALKARLSSDELQQRKIGVYKEIQFAIAEVYKERRTELQGYLDANDYSAYLYSLQLITPQKKSMLGVVELNKLIQSIVNPQENTVECMDGRIGINDKVVHIKNHDMPCMGIAEYEYNRSDYSNKDGKERIFNGFIGVVMHIDDDEDLVWIHYPTDEKVVVYELDQVKDMVMLAYALTIHKSQGSEYGSIIIPICNAFYRMLSNRLIYTAITRSKNHCLMIGDPYSLKVAVNNLDSSNRTTVLQNLLTHNTTGVRKNA